MTDMLMQVQCLTKENKTSIGETLRMCISTRPLLEDEVLDCLFAM